MGSHTHAMTEPCRVFPHVPGYFDHQARRAVYIASCAARPHVPDELTGEASLRTIAGRTGSCGRRAQRHAFGTVSDYEGSVRCLEE